MDVQSTIIDPSQSIKLQMFRYPTETIWGGFRAMSNLTQQNKMIYWNKYYNPIQNPIVCADVDIGSNPAVSLVDTVGWQLGYYISPQNIVDSLTLALYGINWYDTIPIKFYQAVVPYVRNNTVSPEDLGLFMISFNLHPNKDQPSGYINLSRTASELYLGYSSSFISSTNPVELDLVSIAINFILYSDASATLRYST